MKFVVIVDHSSYSERALRELMGQQVPEGSMLCLVMVVNPFVPPPAVAFCSGNSSLKWQIRWRATRRLEELSQNLSLPNCYVETSLCETRIPGSVIAMVLAITAKADQLVVGLHSFFGIKRRLLEAAFKVIKSHSRELRKATPASPNRDPGEDPARQYKQAA
jgi:hypothetical protein